MGDDPVLRMKLAGVIGARFDIDDGATALADDEIRRAGAGSLDHRGQRLIQGPRIKHLTAAHVERLAVGIAAVVARRQSILDETYAAFVHAHLSAGDPGFGEADEAWLLLALDAQHKGAAMHAFEPVPVLAEPGMTIRGDLR